MKKMYFLVSLALIALTQVANAAQPGPLTATKIIGTAPVMDGDNTDAAWATATAQPINIKFKGEETGFGVDGSGDCDASFKVLEDGKKLYFLITVEDDIVCQDAAMHWVGDKVELYFGLPGYVKTAGANASHSRQFAIKAQADKTAMGENGGNNYPPASNSLATNGIEYGYAETATGYLLEVSIDRAIALESLPSGTVPFDVCIADNDEGAGNTGIRYRKSWYNDGAVSELWNNMTGTGSLVLNVATETSAVDIVKENLKYSLKNNTLFVSTSSNVNMEVYDIAGKKVMEVNNSNKMNIASLKAGVFVVNIKTNNGLSVSTIRFIK